MKQLTPENLLDTLVDFACNLRYEDLPLEAVHEAKRRVIDSIGCIFAGRQDPAARLIAEYSDPIETLSVEELAFRFTHLIRVLDWNDTYLSKEPAHPSDNIGVLLALNNRGVSGKDFLTALVLAYEIQCRFCDAASLRKNGWDHTAYVALSSALSSAKILKLNREQMKQAAALALRWIPLRQVRAGSDLSMAKGLSAAEAVKFGLHSARLASWGITGPSEILEGKFGFVNQATGPLDFSAFDSLGKEFKILKTHIKLYPVEYHAQAAVDLALAIRKKLPRGNPNTIKKIDLVSYEACRTIIADPSKRRPNTKESADHSLFYILAVTLLDGEMTLEQYAPKRFSDPAVLRLIDKISDVEEDPDFNRQYLHPVKPAFPILGRVELRSGEEFIIQVNFPKGHFANPLSDSELTAKFAALTLPDIKLSSVKAGLEMIWNLESYAKLPHINFPFSPRP